MMVEIPQARELQLRPCKHQHPCHAEGKAGSLVDDLGHFYKPLQNGPRGERERKFYEKIVSEICKEQRSLHETTSDGHLSLCSDQQEGALNTQSALSLLRLQSSSLQKDICSGGALQLPDEGQMFAESNLRTSCEACEGTDAARDSIPSSGDLPSVSGRTSHEEAVLFERLPFSVRNTVMLRAVPKFYRVIEVDGRQLLELEDVTRSYKHPSIADIKVGVRTWYSGADDAYIQRCKLKDAATTQAALGFKVCGMQVYRHCQRGYWRASKRWCKKMPQDVVSKALILFTDNESGLCPRKIYDGQMGALAQLRTLEQWFQLTLAAGMQKQRDFHFYSSSVLIIYEGNAEKAKDAKVSIRLVDFAHTFPSGGKKDTNFIAGLRAIIDALEKVKHCDLSKDIAL